MATRDLSAQKVTRQQLNQATKGIYKEVDIEMEIDPAFAFAKNQGPYGDLESFFNELPIDAAYVNLMSKSMY